jgi:hypothetical protein
MSLSDYPPTHKDDGRSLYEFVLAACPSFGTHDYPQVPINPDIYVGEAINGNETALAMIYMYDKFIQSYKQQNHG